MRFLELDDDFKELNEDLNKRIKSDRIEAKIFEKYIGTNGVFHEASISVSNGNIQEIKRNIETLSKNSRTLSGAALRFLVFSIIALTALQFPLFGIFISIAFLLCIASESTKNKLEIERKEFNESLFNVSALTISALDSKTFVNLIKFKEKEKEIAFSIFIEHFCNNLEEILSDDEHQYSSFAEFETSPILRSRLQSKVTKKAIKTMKEDPRYLELLKSEKFSKILKAS